MEMTSHLDASGEDDMRDCWSKWQLPLLIIFLMLIWSVLFSGTFTRPFYLATYM